MNMRINLTGLADVANAAVGKFLQLPLADILPDPDNVRALDDHDTPAAIEAQEALNADVAEVGIKTALSVRAHPTIQGKYIINYGHRRYKAACANQLPTVPCMVDERFTTYDQLNENELREGLTTRARALFIKARLDAGESKGEIARRMRRKNQSFITEHLALVDAPDCVNLAYAAGVTSARTLYDLRQAWDECPAQVDAWVSAGVTVTSKTIREALAGFRSNEKTVDDPLPGITSRQPAPEFRSNEKSPTASAPAPVPGARPPAPPAATGQFRSNEKTQQQLPTEARRMLIEVEHDGRKAIVQERSVIEVLYEGEATSVAIPLTAVKILRVFPA